MTLNFGTLAHSNGGVFSRAQALSLGETDRTLAAAVRDGLLVRLRHGMYVAADLYSRTSNQISPLSAVS
jgi:hypothetical protein